MSGIAHSDGILDPAQGAFAITPNDSTSLAKTPRSVYVGGAGDLTVTMLDGSTATFRAVAAGALLPIRVTKVAATGTTATSILGVY